MTRSRNPYGDVELDARGMRALAHPVRLRILETLQRTGPSTATRLAEDVGASPSVVSWHLRHLAEHGLVRDARTEAAGADRRQRWWEAVSRGIRFEATDEESAVAARALSGVMAKVEGDLPGQWADQVEPLLEPAWRRLAGRSRTRVLVTVDELDDLEAAIEDLLAPYVLRKDEPRDRHPEGSRAVVLLRHVLPEAADGSP
jgi:DNA-binding transcriptional ArsR family regulator